MAGGATLARFARRRARAAGLAAPEPEPAQLPARLTLRGLRELKACPDALDWLRAHPGASGADLIDDIEADPYWGVCLLSRLRPDLIRPLASRLKGIGLPGSRPGAADRAAQLASKDPEEASYWMSRAAWLRPLPPLPPGGLAKLPPSKLERRERQKAEGRELRKLRPMIREVVRGLVKP